MIGMGSNPFFTGTEVSFNDCPLSDFSKGYSFEKINKVDLDRPLAKDTDAVQNFSTKLEQGGRELTTEEISTELQPISEELAEKLKEEGILSDNAIEVLHIDTTGNLVLKCINEKLTGEAHEITGVPYVEKTIQVGSEKIKVTVPEFPFKIAIEVPKELWKSGDVHIFKYCTEELRDEIKTNPEMIKQYTPQQLEQIMNGDAYIKGLTWHHSEVPGRMELVPTRIHALSNHTGGNTIWCGGIR